MFGAGGGTSSYEEVEETDLIFLWGSNARETHPIFFHHVLKAVHKGARLYVVDPRRTGSAQWADGWFGIDVGTDIALSNTMAREIIHAGLHNVEFIERATTGFDEYAASVEPWTLERGERETGVPADLIRDAAHAYANAGRAMICWTLGITEHHNAVDNVFCLINLGLLTGHVGRYGSGLNPLRGQNNVQGGGDMGAIPNKLPGFQDIENDHAARARYEQAWGVTIQPKYGWHLTQMFEAMERGDLKALYVVGENPAQSEADAVHTMHLLESLDHIVVQDIFLTRTAEIADVVLPASASWCEAEGTVTNSERRVQRVRRALDPPGQARDDIEIVCEIAARLGHDWGHPTSEEVWNELRSLSPMHAGMTYQPARRSGPAVAVLGRAAPRRAVLARPPLGRAGHRRAGAVQRRRARAPGRRALRRVPDPPHHRPPARLVQHRRPERRVLARRFAAASRSTSRPRIASVSVSSRASRSSSRRAAARSLRRYGSTTRCGPVSPS